MKTELKIYENNIEKQFNTSTWGQQFLNNVFEVDLNKFKIYHCIDNHKGIDLLGLGITSLRKALMDFVNEQFISIRQSLLSQKLERETYNVSKKLYTFYLSTKRKCLLDNGLIQLQDNLLNAKKDLDEEIILINNFKSDKSSKEKIIYYKENENKKASEGICPVLKQKCDRIGNKISSSDKLLAQREIDTVKEEIKEINNMIRAEEEAYNHFYAIVENIEMKLRKTKECIMKLKEAEKFSAYKYTAKDVQLYTDSIKILDSFSSYYIAEWLSNLGIILNDLLRGLNLSVEFSVDKDFIRIYDNGQLLNYSQISGGQKKFLGVIFKLGILLQQGINSGIILFDEGLSEMDVINLYKLIDILHNLSNFQCIIIYQNCPKDLQDAAYINIERKNGESKLIC